MNKQPIEKREASYDATLSVHSIFYTIQGEGPFCGVPAVFVRLAGCNLQCPACDTDYTVGRQTKPVLQILGEVQAADKGEWTTADRHLVVITGGEPFRQHIGELIDLLIAHGYFVQVESNGTMNPPDGPWNHSIDSRFGAYLIISPKTGKLNPLAFQAASALKYVVEANHIREEDGLPLSALRHPSNPYPARPPKGWMRPVYVQPMDAQDEVLNLANRQAAIDSCMKFGYTLQLQVHKIIGVE